MPSINLILSALDSVDYTFVCFEHLTTWKWYVPSVRQMCTSKAIQLQKENERGVYEVCVKSMYGATDAFSPLLRLGFYLVAFLSHLGTFPCEHPA